MRMRIIWMWIIDVDEDYMDGDKIDNLKKQHPDSPSLPLHIRIQLPFYIIKRSREYGDI